MAKRGLKRREDEKDHQGKEKASYGCKANKSLALCLCSNDVQTRRLLDCVHDIQWQPRAIGQRPPRVEGEVGETPNDHPKIVAPYEDETREKEIEQTKEQSGGWWVKVEDGWK